MDYPDYITEHQKGKHLTYEDYVKIQVRLQDGWSANRIAVKELHKSARVCHLHGENLPQYRRLSATSSAPLPPKSSAGNPTDRARRY